MGRKKTTAKFITDAQVIHGNKYSYDKVQYVNSQQKVIITCHKHGDFEQVPNSHLQGNRCQYCSGNNIKSNKGEFKRKSQNIHGDKYDYSKVEYKNNKTKTCIVCPEHGEFWQVPSDHLNGKGCPNCGNYKQGKSFSKNILLEKFKDLIQPEDYKLIPLSKGYYAMVDNEDFDRLKDINWNYNNGYAFNRVVGVMHRLIMNCPDDKVVDHINQELKSDNRKYNLRLATLSQNIWNSRPKRGSSVYKGVSWNKYVDKWTSQIYCNGKIFILGRFTDEEEAGKAYDLKALELFGEFAYLNFPELKQEYETKIKQ